MGAVVAFPGTLEAGQVPAKDRIGSTSISPPAAVASGGGLQLLECIPLIISVCENLRMIVMVLQRQLNALPSGQIRIDLETKHSSLLEKIAVTETLLHRLERLHDRSSEWARPQ